MWPFGLIIAIAGATLIIVGQRMFWIRQMARIRGQKIPGKIVKWKPVHIRGPRSSSASGVMYVPQVVFDDPNGVQRKVTLSYQYTPLFMDTNPIGSTILVLFDPVHPDRTLDSTWTMSYFLPSLLNFCGALVLLIGLGVFFGS